MPLPGATVYILLCADGSYYTSLKRKEFEERVSEHINGKYGGYTALRRPVRLVYSTHFDADGGDRSGTASQGLVARQKGSADSR